MGLSIETHHLRRSGDRFGQNEIGMLFNTLVKKRPTTSRSTSTGCITWRNNYGKTGTFMPLPIVGDNGSGMHVHQSLAEGGKNLFSGNEYGGSSQTALFYIGGIIKHASRAERHHQLAH